MSLKWLFKLIIISTIATAYIQVNANVGNGWDTNRNLFLVPNTGIYFFFFSVGLINGGSPVVSLRVNNVDVCMMSGGLTSLIPVGSTSNVLMDFVGRSCLVSVSKGSEIFIVLTNNNQAYSSSKYSLISFHGFQYSPSNFNPVNNWQFLYNKVLYFRPKIQPTYISNRKIKLIVTLIITVFIFGHSWSSLQITPLSSQRHHQRN